MSNRHPSSKVSDCIAGLKARHNRYRPESALLSVIDNVLVVWLPSVDNCIFVRNGRINVDIMKINICYQMVHKSFNFSIFLSFALSFFAVLSRICFFYCIDRFKTHPTWIKIAEGMYSSKHNNIANIAISNIAQNVYRFTWTIWKTSRIFHILS